MGDVVLAIDVGGTKISVIVQNRHGITLGRREFPTTPNDYRTALWGIIQAGRHLVGSNRLIAVGIGVAGVVVKGVLTGSGNLPGWAGQDIRTDLSQAFGVPAVVLNDAQTAGLGEYAALGRPIICIIWGTGVGVSLVINDDAGHAQALATELGHIIINTKSKLRCGCGGRGHLEAHVSGGNVPKRRFRLFGLLRGRRAEHLSDRQWNMVLREMAAGLRSISAAAPGVPIVMGGGISNKQSQRLPTLQAMVASMSSSCPVPELHLAQHGEDSGLMGAAYAAWQLVVA